MAFIHNGDNDQPLTKAAMQQQIDDMVFDQTVKLATKMLAEHPVLQKVLKGVADKAVKASMQKHSGQSLEALHARIDRVLEQYGEQTGTHPVKPARGQLRYR